uniref:RING-type domain-containing protein n=1 Tax=Poecilia mexicana TaxID=48701 RepID=A0A3B3XRR7_9TELE
MSQYFFYLQESLQQKEGSGRMLQPGRAQVKVKVTLAFPTEEPASSSAAFRDNMSSRPEEDLSCPICQDIFKDPVVLTCSHSFCRACLQTWWRGKKTQECPVCKRKSSQHLCTLHSEKLKIFCLDHQEPVCIICRDSRIHNEHRFRPVDEAAQEYREELQKILKPLQDKLAVLQDAKADGDQTLKFIKLQSQQTEKQIREQFQKLHQFLQQEETAKVAALQQEEAKKSGVMKEKVAALSREIAALSATITAAQAEVQSDSEPWDILPLYKQKQQLHSRTSSSRRVRKPRSFTQEEDNQSEEEESRPVTMETEAEARFHALPPEWSFLYFTEQGDGSGQVLPLVPSLVQLHEAHHQVTVATVSITNEPRLAQTPAAEG